MSHLYVLRTETQNVPRKCRLGNAGDAARHLEYLRVRILCDMFDDCFERDGLGNCVSYPWMGHVCLTCEHLM